MDVDYAPPNRWMIDKSSANPAGLDIMNPTLMILGFWCFIDILKVKSPNTIIEQDHRFSKKFT